MQKMKLLAEVTSSEYKLRDSIPILNQTKAPKGLNTKTSFDCISTKKKRNQEMDVRIIALERIGKSVARNETLSQKMGTHQYR